MANVRLFNPWRAGTAPTRPPYAIYNRLDCNFEIDFVFDQPAMSAGLSHTANAGLTMTSKPWG